MLLKKIVNDDTWYPCICNTCGWIGSSEYCGSDMGVWGDSDVYCPRCGSPDTDEYSDRYPIHHFITDLFSRFKAWRITTREAKYWNDMCKKLEDD